MVLCRGHKMRCCVIAPLIFMHICSLGAMNENPQRVKAKVLIYLDAAAWFNLMNKALKEQNWHKIRSLVEFLDSAVNPVSLANIVSGQRKTLLMMAAYFDTVATVERILRYVRPKDLIDYVNAYDRNGYTALDYAAFHHRMKIIEVLRPYAYDQTMEQVEKVLHDADSCGVLRRLDNGILMRLSGKKGASHQDPSDEDDGKMGN